MCPRREGVATWVRAGRANCVDRLLDQMEGGLSRACGSITRRPAERISRSPLAAAQRRSWASALIPDTTSTAARYEASDRGKRMAVNGANVDRRLVRQPGQ